MKSNFNSVAVVARENLKTSGFALGLGHIHQMLAAGLGYNSLAALQASAEETPGLAGANFLILDVGEIGARARALGLGVVAPKVADAIVAAIKADPQPPRVFLDPREFIDDVVCQFANDNVCDNDAVSSAAAETNAYFGEANIELAADPIPLKNAREFWEVPVSGSISMDQDQDKPFSGDNILVSGVVKVWKAGRVCFTNDMELSVDAHVDNSYYEME